VATGLCWSRDKEKGLRFDIHSRLSCTLVAALMLTACQQAKDLHDKGLITRDEYQAKKQDILADM